MTRNIQVKPDRFAIAWFSLLFDHIKFQRATENAYWKLKPYQRKWWERLL